MNSKVAYGSAAILAALLIIGGISTAADIKETVAKAAVAPKAKSGSMTPAEWRRCFAMGASGGDC